ncbi:unnamed protein product [Tuber melanosporum]|uniref:Store-operated calcium entry-associated regulatory factor n=1 Tax=Tuber melanosporum (strain Mel28) TaxID=656061 RepID=D5GDU9_TUBMM|nr:uncharacterized protein GSTUM_00006282001 [Tuber melanosporum]CAZ82692.1 unnamed protein product [Tuber melanosporum]
MKLPTVTIFLLATSAAAAKLKSGQKILLSEVPALTLRSDQMTKNRRVPAVPQLKCVGGEGKGKYEVDVMRCKNIGSDYNDEYVSWSCTADLPREFKLGSTDVICEGYDSADDQYVLKGSCGVEYRLALTDYGYEKFGYGGSVFKRLPSKGIEAETFLFWTFFFGIVGWILYSVYKNRNNSIPRAREPRRPGGGGGWFGGGGGDPPPPYDPRPPPKPAFPSSSSQQWRPGFWSGLAAGAAGSYLMGNRERANQTQTAPQWFQSSGGPSGGYGGPSWGGGGGGGESSSAGAMRHSSTGYGQTRRR